ncbi:MAG: PKD domain-containing protein [Flavobacteriaceae bacterium]|nr:PKD domain-containing protein [Flavobacteriaceae bacterium]
MKKSKVILKIIMGLLFLLYSNDNLAQTSGIGISWNVEAGCQTYSQGQPPRDTKDPIFIEDILEGTCIKVCEGSIATYTLYGNTANNQVVWTISGGTVLSQSTTACTVEWGLVGPGSVNFTIYNPNGNVTKTICIEKVIKPTSLFTITPFANNNDTDDLMGCSNQTIYFSNQSSANNGTSLVSYLWDFGDGIYSSAFEPSHVYQQDGTYLISLTVMNSCGCIGYYEHKIFIGKKGFDIQCPSVVCEGQSVTYTLPFAAEIVCRDRFNWVATGGEITDINQHNGNVTVNWNSTDATGFGYLTFLPENCRLSCLLPSTIKIPVIQSHGTIVGDANLCVKQQARYKLPQWPTTDFQWEIVGNQNGLLANVILTDQRNEVIIQPLVSGALVLRATYQNTLLHCGGTAFFTINVSQAYEFTGEEKVCQNTTSTYVLNAGATSDWILTDSSHTVVATETNSATFTYTFTTAGNYTLSAAGSAICVGQQKNITVVSLPQVPVAAGALLVCPNAPYNYSITNPNPALRYRWVISNGTFNGSSIGNTVSVNFNGSLPAQLTYYAETTSPKVCSSSAATLTVAYQQINAEISAAYATVCANSNTAEYQANVLGGSALYTEGEIYNWSISNPVLGSVSSGQGTNHISVVWNNVSLITTVDLVLTITKCTLTKTIVKTVTIYPLPHLVIAPVATTCSGAPATFTLSSNNGVAIAPGSMVVWDFGYGNIAPIAAPGGLTQSCTYSNITSANIGKTVTAFIQDPNGCLGTTNTASVSFEVLPAPPASASLSSQFNTFCTKPQINATLTAGTLASGVTIQWYNNATLLVGATGATLTANASTGFGAYYFVATNSLGCSSTSNPVMIIKNCGNVPCNYSPTPTIVNNASQNCGTLNLVGSATGTPQQLSWSILGPNTDLASYTGATYVATQAGEYHTFYNGDYLSTSGTICRFSDSKIVTVPYIPDFGYAVTCNGNTTFTINFTDKTNVFAMVTSPTIVFSYKLNSASSYTAVSGTSVSGIAPGNYQLKVSVTGFLNGVLQPICEKVIGITIANVPSQNISILTQPNCYDTSISFGFTGFPVPTDTYLWTFETGATNTLPNPSYVFTTPGPKVITLLITNKYGCSRTLTTTLTVPEKCFNGDIFSVPTSPIVCEGQTVTINYVGNNDACVPSQYVWMDGTSPVVGAPNAPSLQVSTSGFYWLKVFSSSGCLLETTKRITPIFKSLPSIKIEAPSSICSGGSLTVNAITNASLIAWYVDGVLDSSMVNQIAPMFYGLGVGTHTITGVATINGCSASASQAVTVMSTPDVPQITYEIVGCSPYRVKLSATSNVSEFFTWSNGMSGSDIEVTDGGPYLVRVTSGDCSATAQVDVPKNPENFIWIFPTGCFRECWSRKESSTLIGPRLPLHYWGWLQNDVTVSSGSDTFTTPFSLTQSGVYNLEINTGVCGITSAPLDYTLVECPKCPVTRVAVKEVKINETKYCSFNLILEIVNGMSSNFPVTITSPNNEVILVPASFTLLPNSSAYAITVIPNGTFNGGLIHLTINGLTAEGQPCSTDFTVTLPSCEGRSEGKPNGFIASEIATFSMVLAPNPANEQVTLNYKGLQEAASVVIYDLTGRVLTELNIEKEQGTSTIATGGYPSGIYIVVVRVREGIVMQQKLIIE